MKKLFFSILTVSGALFTVSQAQQGYIASSGKSFNNRITAIATTGPSELSIFESTNKKAYQNFITHYSNATNVSVITEASTTFVYFKNAGIQTRVRYNMRGDCLHTIRYYDANELPQAVKVLINEEFSDYIIFGVTEITVKNKTAYFVTIENATKCKNVKVVDGEFRAMETLLKAG